MIDNLPKKFENNFIVKLKRFFAKVFFKKKNNINVEGNKEKSVEQEDVNITPQVDIFKEWHKEKNEVKIKEDIVHMIDKNPELIDKLSVKQLKALNEMYTKLIEENNRIIKDLERRLS